MYVLWTQCILSLSHRYLCPPMPNELVAPLVYAVYLCIGVLAALVELVLAHGTVYVPIFMLCLDIFIVYLRYFVLSTPLFTCVCVAFVLDSVPCMCQHCFVVHALSIFLYVFTAGCFYGPEVLLLVGCILCSVYCCLVVFVGYFQCLVSLHSVHNEFIRICSLLGACGLVFVWGLCL